MKVNVNTEISMSKSKETTIVQLNPADNVIISVHALKQDTVIKFNNLRCNQNIPCGHKIAIRSIKENEAIRKYNQLIGFATKNINPGDHVHSHNCAMAEFSLDYSFCSDVTATNLKPPQERTFQGYRRSNAKVGTRNYIGLITTVNCSATVARLIADTVEKQNLLLDYPNIDGIIPLTHGTGCGMAAQGESYDILARTLWGYAAHPNFAGILMLGLGCEVMQISTFMQTYGLKTSDTFRLYNIQSSGGTRKTIEAGVRVIQEMLPLANSVERESIPVSEITLALQCGGSDAWSGVSANPALGQAADLLVNNGGTAVLSETPEIYGAEHLLTRRAINREVAEKLIQRIQWWQEYTRRNNMEMNNNPSPGNKEGGLTTILEKSLGAVAKGGTSNLTDVYLYAEQIKKKGFVFMDSPGFDPCSITGQVASGANIICFTTGRGSVYGYKPVPSIKLATNTPMYQRMLEDIDINCGTIVDGKSTVEEKGEEIFNTIIKIASGEASKSELLGFGSYEFVPWQTGAVM